MMSHPSPVCTPDSFGRTMGSSIESRPWWLGPPALVILLAIRLLAAARAPIMDCDETFNYWEPLHYVLHGTGMQTWEYAPQYALRSYVYIELHALVLRVLPASLTSGPSGFYALRQCLALACASSEVLFCRAVAFRFGTRTAALLLIFLSTGCGMFHAGIALLPSTTCMYGVLLGYSAWLSGRPRTHSHHSLPPGSPSPYPTTPSQCRGR